MAQDMYRDEVKLQSRWPRFWHHAGTDRREPYANDLDAEPSLEAVSSGPHRTKGDKDPAEWMPPAKGATCTHTADWVSTKLRWALTADRIEKGALAEPAAGCADSTVSHSPAPWPPQPVARWTDRPR
ncbi:hypothetical protein [Streptomyces sp. DB-54]